ncbi:putative Extracellular membrane protein CFEM domain-containing protein [Seiridium cardinale]|uniref:Extracellular membrane protein CFEM domain-containing protein n=1 Tax=Seiridium cardinale TaxID=138064 RepID=A0ABR2Y6X7_9PEZI
MALKPLLQQLLIWTSISIANAHDVNLTSEVSAFIPSCAQGCFKAFIHDNYDSVTCGDTPSLQCLCSHESTAGLTVGEAAAECIGGSSIFGVCTADEGNQAGIAYQMCSGETSALPNTQPTPLSAAFVVGGGSVRIATSAITSSTHATSSSTASTDTSTTPAMTTATRSSTSSAPPTSATSTIPVETATPQTTETPVPTAVSLGNAQIVGISVGVAGAIILALGAIFMARRARRRRYPGLDEEGFQSMDEKSSFGGGGAASRLTKIFHISPPILKPQRSLEFQSSPQVAEYQNIDRNTIGIAISRPRSEIVPKQQTPTRERRTSKLLPPKPLRPSKPNLTLAIPNAVHPALRPQSSQPQTDRTSTMTNMTAFADLDTEAPEGGQIWRPPPSDPLSATTYYVADKWGNWVLGNTNRQSQLAGVAEAAELDTYTPLTKSPIEKQEEAAALATAISAASAPEVSMPQQAFFKPNGRDTNVSRASSQYSQASASRGSWRPPLPVTKRSSSSGRRRPSRSDSKTSMDSATTIQTSSSAGGPYDESPPVEEEEPSRLSALSPVMESPHTPTGRSPVRYPKIPGRLDLTTIRMVPPPKRPDFTASPPGQPSPTLGTVLPVRGSPSAYPQPLNTRRNPRPQLGRAPNLPQPQQASGSGFSPKQPSLSRFPMPPPNPPPRSELRLSRQNPPRLETQGLPPPRAQISSYISPTSAVTTSSVASSLLAKRIGSEKAAALSLENGQKRGAAGWKRHGPGGLLSPEMAGMMSPGPRGLGTGGLPATPTWQPKLTPTRRGDDLFLNVQ